MIKNIAKIQVLNHPCLPIWPKICPKSLLDSISNIPLICKFLFAGYPHRGSDVRSYVSQHGHTYLADDDLPYAILRSFHVLTE